MALVQRARRVNSKASILRKNFEFMDSKNPLALMAVLAHPDDETFGMGAVLASCAAQGVQVHVLTATRGFCDWFGLPAPGPDYWDLDHPLEQELYRAAGVLGIHSVTLLDFEEGKLDQTIPADVISHISTHLRLVRPQVVVTFSPDGFSGHPDHIAISQLTHAALVRAADPQDRESGSFPPHQVSKLYYLVRSRKFARLVETVFGEVAMIVEGVPRRSSGWDEWMLSCRVPVDEYWQTAWNAILCQQSWHPGVRSLARLDEKILAVLFSDGAFYRVFSLVNGGRQPEHDLFAGLHE